MMRTLDSTLRAFRTKPLDPSLLLSAYASVLDALPGKLFALGRPDDPALVSDSMPTLVYGFACKLDTGLWTRSTQWCWSPIDQRLPMELTIELPSEHNRVDTFLRHHNRLYGTQWTLAKNAVPARLLALNLVNSADRG